VRILVVRIRVQLKLSSLCGRLVPCLASWRQLRQVTIPLVPASDVVKPLKSFVQGRGGERKRREKVKVSLRKGEGRGRAITLCSPKHRRHPTCAQLARSSPHSSSLISRSFYISVHWREEGGRREEKKERKREEKGDRHKKRETWRRYRVARLAQMFVRRGPSPTRLFDDSATSPDRSVPRPLAGERRKGGDKKEKRGEE